MKVGLVSPYDFASPGGVTDHVQHLARQLRLFGHAVRIFAPSSRADIDFDTREFYRIGSPIAIPVNDSVARITLSFHLANQVAAIIEQERFDVVHFHEPLMPALPITMLGVVLPVLAVYQRSSIDRLRTAVAMFFKALLMVGWPLSIASRAS